MSNSNQSSNTGIGFMGLLTIVLIVLKLIKEIDWSWWWILAPLWIPFSVFSLIMLFLWIKFSIKK